MVADKRRQEAVRLQFANADQEKDLETHRLNSQTMDALQKKNRPQKDYIPPPEHIPNRRRKRKQYTSIKRMGEQFEGPKAVLSPPKQKASASNQRMDVAAVDGESNRRMFVGNTEELLSSLAVKVVTRTH